MLHCRLGSTHAFRVGLLLKKTALKFSLASRHPAHCPSINNYGSLFVSGVVCVCLSVCLSRCLSRTGGDTRSQQVTAGGSPSACTHAAQGRIGGRGRWGGEGGGGGGSWVPDPPPPPLPQKCTSVCVVVFFGTCLSPLFLCVLYS